LRLFELLLSLEEEEGLPLEKVEKQVSENDVISFLWDKFVGRELTEEQLIFLSLLITHISIKIVLRGIIKRRINEQLKTAHSSVTQRASLARNKQKNK